MLDLKSTPWILPCHFHTHILISCGWTLKILKAGRIGEVESPIHLCGAQISKGVDSPFALINPPVDSEIAVDEISTGSKRLSPVATGFFIRIQYSSGSVWFFLDVC